MSDVNLKWALLYKLDAGGHIDTLKRELLNDSFDKDAIDQEFDALLADGTLTMGKVSKQVVVTKDMPRAAEKLSKE